MLQKKSKLYYVGKKNATKGPYSLAVLVGKVEQGLIKPRDLCWCEGMEKWEFVQRVIERDVIRTPEQRQELAQQPPSRTVPMEPHPAITALKGEIGWLSGLKIRWGLIQSARKKSFPHARITSGDYGEELVLHALRQWQRNCPLHVEIRQAVRVPRRENQGKYEIDFVVITPNGMVLIEVKYWSGTVLRSADGGVMQKNDSGRRTMHACPLDLLERKKEVLFDFMTTRNGLIITPRFMHTLVVMANSNCVLGSCLQRHSNLLCLPDLEHKLNSLGLYNPLGLWHKVMHRFGWRCPPANPVFYRSWDEVNLYGGRRIKCDILSRGVKLVRQRPIHRGEVTRINFSTPRSYWTGLWRNPHASFQRHGKRHRVKYEVFQQLKVRPSGEQQVMFIPIEHIEKIEFGSNSHGINVQNQAKPALRSYLGRTFLAQVASVQKYGIFVNLDGWRDGFIPSRLLEGQRNYLTGEKIKVVVTSAQMRNEKEEISCRPLLN